MEDYPDRWVEQQFLAIVNECETVISSNSVNIADVSTGWGDDAITISYASAFASYTMSPDCGYDLTVTPKLKLLDGTLVDLTTAPYSMGHDASKMEVYVEKCSATTSFADPDCANDPYEIIFDIVFAVESTGASNVNTDLEVRVEVGNTCLTDTLAISKLTADGSVEVMESDAVTYLLTVPSTPSELLPTMLQGYSFCPYQCTLVETSALGIVGSVISFNQNTGAIQVDTDTRELHGYTLDLKMSCSPSYNTEAAASEFNFSITFADDCYNTVIGQPAAADSTTALFINHEVPFTTTYSTKQCGMISYSLLHLNDDGTDPASSLDLTNSKMLLLGTAADHAGMQYFMIKACVTTYSEG